VVVATERVQHLAIGWVPPGGSEVEAILEEGVWRLSVRCPPGGLEPDSA